MPKRIWQKESTWWPSEEGKDVCPGTDKDDIHHPILRSRRRAGVRPQKWTELGLLEERVNTESMQVCLSKKGTFGGVWICSKIFKVPPQGRMILFLACWHNICGPRGLVHRSDRCHCEQPWGSLSPPFSLASVLETPLTRAQDDKNMCRKRLQFASYRTARGNNEVSLIPSTWVWGVVCKCCVNQSNLSTWYSY